MKVFAYATFEVITKAKIKTKSFLERSGSIFYYKDKADQGEETSIVFGLLPKVTERGLAKWLGPGKIGFYCLSARLYHIGGERYG